VGVLYGVKDNEAVGWGYYMELRTMRQWGKWKVLDVNGIGRMVLDFV